MGMLVNRESGRSEAHAGATPHGVHPENANHVSRWFLGNMGSGPPPDSPLALSASGHRG